MNPALRVALRWTLAAIALTFLVLLATGLWLSWNYRPPEAARWVIDGHLGNTAAWARRVQLLHRWTGVQLIVLAVGLLGEAIAWAISTHRLRRAVAGFAALIFVLLADFSGFLIAWDELALFSVTIGTNISGFGSIFTNELLYVLVGRSVVGIDTIRRWFWIHTVATPLAIAVIIGMMLVMLRRALAAIVSPAGSDADEIRRTSWRSRS